MTRFTDWNVFPIETTDTNAYPDPCVPRPLPNDRNHTPECILTRARMRCVAHPKPQNRNERSRFRSMLDCAIVFGSWEESSGKSRIGQIGIAYKRCDCLIGCSDGHDLRDANLVPSVFVVLRELLVNALRFREIYTWQQYSLAIQAWTTPRQLK